MYIALILHVIVALINTLLLAKSLSDSKTSTNIGESKYNDEAIATRDYTLYDKRIEQLQTEINAFNNAPSNAISYDSNVYNLPHSIVQLEDDMFPSVEEECESSIIEVSQ